MSTVFSLSVCFLAFVVLLYRTQWRQMAQQPVLSPRTTQAKRSGLTLLFLLPFRNAAGISARIVGDTDDVTHASCPLANLRLVTLCFAMLVGVAVSLWQVQPAFAQTNTCFTSLDGATTFASSADAQAVRDAIAAANPGDRVRIAGTCAGVSTQSGTSQVALITKMLTLAGGYTNTNWSLQSPSTHLTILDALASGRGIYAFEPLTVEHLIVQNGVATNSQGGGIYAGNSLLLVGGQISNSVATGPSYPIGLGGGVYVGGVATLTGTSFLSNTASDSGGGAYLNYTATLMGTTFLSNTAGNWGGGAYVYEAATLMGTSFLGNTAGNWGGGAMVEGAATLTGTSFLSNTAGNNGGGAFVLGAATLTGTSFLSNTAGNNGGGAYVGRAATLTGTSFLSNTAGANGGGLAADSTVILTETSFVSNTAATNGGGAYIGGDANLTAATFLANSAADGSGLFVNSGNAVVTESDFVQNTSGQAGALRVGGYTTITDSTWLSNTAGVAAGGWIDGGATVVGSLFQNNQATSGDGGGLYVNNGLLISTTDFISNTAAGKGGGLYSSADLIMSATHFISNTAGSEGGGTWVMNEATIAHSHFIANQAQDGSGLFVSSGNAAIGDSHFAQNSSSQAGALRVGGDATITNSTWLSNTAGSAAGGWIQGSASVAGSLFQNNQTNSGDAGALYIGSNMSITASKFISNVAAASGGALTHDADAGRIVNSLFVDNQGQGWSSAAIVLNSSSTVEILHSTIVDSSASAPTTFGSLGSRAFVAQTVEQLQTAGDPSHDDDRAQDEAARVAADARDVQALRLAQMNSAGVGAAALNQSAIIIWNGEVHVYNTVIVGYNVSIENNSSGALYEDHNLYSWFDLVPVLSCGCVLNAGGHSVVGGDPDFVDPAALDYRLGTNSAALALAADRGITDDIDGATRPQNGLDSGAYESTNALVTGPARCYATLDDGATVLQSEDAQAVRDAVSLANAGDTVKIAGYCSGLPHLYADGEGSLVLVTQTLSLIGGYTATQGLPGWVTSDPATHPTIFDPQALGRSFFLTSPVTLSALTLQHGYIVFAGGAILADEPLTLTAMTVISNEVTGYGPGTGYGGALDAWAPVSIAASYFADNWAVEDGGAIYSADTLEVSTSTFSHNETGDDGGALYGKMLITVVDSLFNNQWAWEEGGALYSEFDATVRNSDFVENGAGEDSGALEIDNDLTIEDSRFISNSASWSGGALDVYGLASISDGYFFNNVALEDGGAIVSDGLLLISHTQFISNSSQLTGGAIHAHELWITTTDFISNSSPLGGAVFLHLAIDSQIANSLFESNAASDEGGAIFVTEDSVLGLQANQLLRNMAVNGGGAIYVSQATLDLLNNIFAQNQSVENAADIDIGGAPPAPAVPASVWGNHNTFAAAQPGQGAAIMVGREGPDESVVLSNTIFADYAVGVQTGPLLSSAQLDGVLWDNVIMPTEAIVDGLPATITFAYSGTAGFVGPSIDNYHLTESSLAINRAIASAVADDIDGDLRPQRDFADLGADESPFTTGICFATADDGTTVHGSFDSGAVRLAIADAIDLASDEVKVAGYCAGVVDVDGTIQLALVTTTLTMRGGYTDTLGGWDVSYPITQPTTLDALSGGRVIYASQPLTVENLIVQNGLADAENGGGIYAGSDLWLIGSQISNSMATSGGANGYGGGAYVSGAATVEASLVQNNHAAVGGGGLYFGQLVQISTTVFSGNDANQGGAIYAASPDLGSWIAESRFQSNTASDEGGAIFTYDSDGMTIERNWFGENQADNGGGAIYIGENYNPDTLINNLFVRNLSLNGPSADIDLDGSSIATVIVQHNTHVAADATQSALHAGTMPGNVLTVTNSILHGYGTAMWTSPDTQIVADGILFDGVLTQVDDSAGGLIVLTNPYVGGAAFVDAVNDDYRLTQASAAIDLGADVGVVDDYTTASRPQGSGFDLGAFESNLTLPTLSIGDGSVIEGDSGVVIITMPITLSFAKAITVTALYTTTDDSATTADNDYAAVNSGLITFAPGMTTTVISLTVQGDSLVEIDETFLVALGSPEFATLDDGEGSALINNDDVGLCFASLGNKTEYASSDAAAVRAAIAVAAPGATVKVAGYCAGVISEAGTVQVALITKTLTVIGGYTETNWLVADPVVNLTTLDALAAGRVISISAGVSVTLQGLQITGGNDPDQGAGIYNQGELRLLDSWVFGNETKGSGGGLFSTEAMRIVGSTFLSNTAGFDGGGAYIHHLAEISATHFVGNHAGNDGGGFYLDALGATIIASEFISNTADGDGGGAYLDEGTANISATTFISNSAADFGGGLWVSFGSDTWVQHSWFINNQAGEEGGALFLLFNHNLHLVANQLLRNRTVEGGGAIYLSGSTVDLVNNLFAQNQSSSNGQDIDIGREGVPSSLTGRHNTFVAATVGSGPSIIVGREFVNQSAVLSNTIFADYGVGVQTGPNTGVVILDGVLWDNLALPTQAVGAGSAATIANAILGDAAFANPAGDDYRLLAASAAVNVGAEVGVVDDFEGEARPQQGLPDFGYDESLHFLPTLTVGDANVTEGNSGTVLLSFPITLSFAKGTTVTVQYGSSDNTAQASSGDYQAASGVVTFAPGETSKVVTVVVNGETVIEVDEGLGLILSSPQYAMLGNGEARGAIFNDDALAINLSDGSVVEGNNGTTNAVFTVTLSQISALTVAVDYAVSDGSVPGQAALAGVDYQSTSGTLTFAAGEISKVISVLVIGETLVENDEQFTVSLSNVSGASAALGDGSGVGLIGNDDSTVVSIGDATVTEGNSGVTNASVAVTLSNPSALTVTVNYAVNSGILPGQAATVGSDFTAGGGTVTFAPGQTSQPVTVAVLGENLVESDESFSVDLSNPQGAMIGDGSGVGTIVNDDSTALSIADVSVTEGNSGLTNAVFTVQLSNPSASAVTVSYATSDGILPGQAATVADDDYTASSGSVAFAPGQTSQLITVTVKGDLADRSPECCILKKSVYCGTLKVLHLDTGFVINRFF